MALPANVSLCQVSGLYLYAQIDGSDPGRATDGVPAVGLTITIEASQPLVFDRSAVPPTTIALKPIVVKTDLAGQLIDPVSGEPGIYIVASDDPDLGDPFYYTVTITGPGWPTESFPFVAPSNGSVDLTENHPLIVINGIGVTKGDPGAPGPAANLSVRDVFSVPNTEPARVVIDGTPPDQEITFYIPRGQDGASTAVPSGGWTKNDLNTAIQASLDKADTAVQPAAISSFGNVKTVNGTLPDGTGNVTIATGGGGSGTIGDTTPASAMDSNTGTFSLNTSVAQTTRLTLGANTTFALDPGATGLAYTHTLVCVQDATGARVATWPSTVKWSYGAPAVLSTAPNAIDVINFLWTGNEWVGSVGGQAIA